ncbi:MAG: histidinol-phosphate transaminase [Pseudomonadota bacterium]|nr:histidinol-phosphate transaminase [Pseudomonadota bacterium]
MTAEYPTPEKLIRAEVRELDVYHVPSADGLVKLDAMENPYGWPPELVQGWLAAIRDVPLNRYPDPVARDLLPLMRAAMAVPDGAEILLGNGSDELIQILMTAVAGARRSVLAPEPGFVMYRLIARALGLNYVGVPLRSADFSLDLPALLKAVELHRPALIFLAYPNNPTGNLFNDSDIERILEAASGLVVIDEAYAPFANATWMPRLAQYPHLLILRTLSKLGLAGLRLGLLVGSSEWIREMDKVRLPYNINALTQRTAQFALEHNEVLLAQAEQIRAERGRLFGVLGALKGVTAYPSRANFILFRVHSVSAPAVYARLLDDGILIKQLHGAHPMLENCLRVTVGTPEENQRFLDSLAGVV